MKKRFIAGAVCPRCSAMDRIMMFETEDGTFRECVDCGFADKQPEEPDPGAAELQTRVTPTGEPEPPKKDDNPQPIRFVPSGSDTRH